MEIVEQEGQQTETQPEKIFDADNDKWIDNPALKKEESTETAKEKPKKEAPKASEQESEEEEPEEESEEEEEGEESEGEESEEEPEEESEEEEEKPKEKEDEALSPDGYVEAVFGEKYGLKTESDLTKTIDNALELMDELDEVKKERDALKTESAKPKFTSKAQESAYEFVSKFDPSMQGEALQTFAKLITMDIDNGDPRMLLEEQFVHQNPQWSRAEAQRMFNKEHNKKYTLAREKFDGTDEEYAEEQKDMEIMRKGDIARAKTYLKDLKDKHKPAEAEKPKVNESVNKAIAQNAKTYNDFVEKTGEVHFGDGEDKFTFKLDANRKAQVSEAMKNWVGNPNSYDEKGTLVGASSPEEMLNTIIGGLFLKEIVNAVRDGARSKAAIKRVDEIADKKPKKRLTPGSGEAKGNKDDLDEQALRLIKKKAA